MTQIPCGNSEELRYGSLWGPDSPAATLPQAHTYTFAMTAMALLHRDPTHVAAPWDLGVLDAFCAALVRACSRLPPSDRVAPSLLQHLVHCLSTLAPRAAASTSPAPTSCLYPTHNMVIKFRIWPNAQKPPALEMRGGSPPPKV